MACLAGLMLKESIQVSPVSSPLSEIRDAAERLLALQSHLFGELVYRLIASHVHEIHR